jgi:hypothetical protein
MHRMNGQLKVKEGIGKRIQRAGSTFINLPNSWKQAKVSFFGFTS